MTQKLSDILREADAANAKPVETDELGDAVIAHSLVPNSFILNLNRSLAVPDQMDLPAPWNLPSRMFKFPIELTGDMDGLPRRIGLVHPLLIDHPFVHKVSEALGFELDPNGAPNKHGYRTGGYAEWWHAVDLVCAGMWKELLATDRFTTPQYIAGAVSHGLSYSRHDSKTANGYLTTIEARKMLAHIQAPEPEDRAGALRHFMRPMSLRAEGGKESWPINMASGTQIDKAWASVISIEAGWFTHDRSGFLGWSAPGRDKYMAIVGAEEMREPVSLPEKAVEEPTREPTGNNPQSMQLSLF